jgi:hypothetical protein
MQYRLIVGRVRGREAIVAGVGTLHKGFSIEYAWAQVGSAAERRQAATEIEWPGSDVYLITAGGTGQVVAAS